MPNNASQSLNCETSFCYRPQRSCGQGNIFTPVCHSVHRGGLPQCMLGYHPPRTRQTPPRDQTPPTKQTTPPPPDQADTPPGTRQTPPRTRQTPLPGTRQTPPGTRQTPPWTRQTPPPREADSSIRSASGRYASYWNTFLLCFVTLHLLKFCIWTKYDPFFHQKDLDWV